MINKKVLFVSFIFLFFSTAFASTNEPSDLDVFKKAFPQVTFSSDYDREILDWIIQVSYQTGNKTKQETFYWCQGRMLPPSELDNKDLYLPILEHYQFGEKLQNPSEYTQEQIEAFRQEGLSSTRKNQPFPAPFLLDFLYSSSSRKEIEQNLSRITFLGYKITVNTKIVEPLSKVENRLVELQKTNPSVASFLSSLDHLDCYNWREIRDVERRSLHSAAIAIDFLPKKMNKHMYWRWTKDQKGDSWMLTPLEKRWIPPYEIIDVFEEEGFIWGGKWLIWDNMHFEYRPELIEFYKKNHTK